MGEDMVMVIGKMVEGKAIVIRDTGVRTSELLGYIIRVAVVALNDDAV